MRQFEDVLYVNIGDWVESGTAVGETMDGKLEMIRWMDVAARRERLEHPSRRRPDDRPEFAPISKTALGYPRSAPMRLLVATDAWHPQVNGVVRTYEHFGNTPRPWATRSHF